MLFIQNDVFIQEKNILPNCSSRIAYLIFIEAALSYIKKYRDTYCIALPLS